MKEIQADLSEIDVVEVTYNGLILNIYVDPEGSGQVLTQVHSEDGGRRIGISPLPDNQTIIGYGFLPEATEAHKIKPVKHNSKLRLASDD